MMMTASRIATHITAKAVVMARAKYKWITDNECNEILRNMNLGVAPRTTNSAKSPSYYKAGFFHVDASRQRKAKVT